MKSKKWLRPLRRAFSLFVATAIILPATMGLGSLSVQTVSANAGNLPPRQAEYLDRGVVAIRTPQMNHVFVQWRLLGTDPVDARFNIYRDDGSGFQLIQSNVYLTNFQDFNGRVTSRYAIGMVTGGSEVSRSAGVGVLQSQFIEIPVGNSRPRATMTGVTHVVNDGSVGDLTGNGQLDVVFMWQPDNARDSAHDGRTDHSHLAAYTLGGAHLWSIDIGPNIRSGQHDIHFLVYDFAGIGRSQVAVRTAEGTVDGLGRTLMLNNSGQVEWRANVNPNTVRLWTFNRTTGVDINGGRNLQGPLFLTVFDGLTGEALDTVPYIPQTQTRWYSELAGFSRPGFWRGPAALQRTPNNHSYWGDNQGNRAERYNAAVAYLNGTTPSMIFQRGYFWSQNANTMPGRVTVAAFNFCITNGISHVWTFDTFCEQRGGLHPVNQVVRGKGNHNISVGDPIGDGRDRIFLGSSAINYDGTLFWYNRNGHGDAMHLGAFIPPASLRNFTTWDSRTNRYYGAPSFLQLYNALCDSSPFGGGVLACAATGRTIVAPSGTGVNNVASTGPRHLQRQSDRDTDRGMIGVFGEFGGYAVMNAGGGVGSFNTNNQTVNGVGGNSFRIFWNGGLWDQVICSSGNNGPVRIHEFRGSGLTGTRHLIFEDTTALTVNGTKAVPVVTADIIGDWRENFVARTACNNFIRVYITITPTQHRLTTFMHDPLYRLGVAWQNSSYNQPPRISFYLADRAGHRNLQPRYNIFTPNSGGSNLPVYRPHAGIYGTRIAGTNFNEFPTGAISVDGYAPGSRWFTGFRAANAVTFAIEGTPPNRHFVQGHSGGNMNQAANSHRALTLPNNSRQFYMEADINLNNLRTQGFAMALYPTGVSLTGTAFHNATPPAPMFRLFFHGGSGALTHSSGLVPAWNGPTTNEIPVNLATFANFSQLQGQWLRVGMYFDLDAGTVILVVTERTGSRRIVQTINLPANVRSMSPGFLAFVNWNNGNATGAPITFIDNVEYGTFTNRATPITNVNLTVPAPVSFQPRTTTVSRTGFTGTIQWNPSSGSAFTANTIYTAAFTLTANAGHTFAGITNVMVNGQTATIVGTPGTTLTVTFAFPRTGHNVNIPYFPGFTNVAFTDFSDGTLWGFSGQGDLSISSANVGGNSTNKLRWTLSGQSGARTASRVMSPAVVGEELLASFDWFPGNYPGDAANQGEVRIFDGSGNRILSLVTTRNAPVIRYYIGASGALTNIPGFTATNPNTAAGSHDRWYSIEIYLTRATNRARLVVRDIISSQEWVVNNINIASTSFDGSIGRIELAATRGGGNTDWTTYLDNIGFYVSSGTPSFPGFTNAVFTDFSDGTLWGFSGQGDLSISTANVGGNSSNKLRWSLAGQSGARTASRVMTPAIASEELLVAFDWFPGNYPGDSANQGEVRVFDGAGNRILSLVTARNAPVIRYYVGAAGALTNIPGFTATNPNTAAGSHDRWYSIEIYLNRTTNRARLVVRDMTSAEEWTVNNINISSTGFNGTVGRIELAATRGGGNTDWTTYLDNIGVFTRN